MTARIEHKLNVFHQRCLRKILKVAYKDHITNEEILLWANSRKLSDIITERRFRMAGHILCLPDHRAGKVAISWVQRMAGVKQDAPRRRGAELSSRICRWSTSSGRRLTMLQLTVLNGAKLLPDVPKGTGSTKSKSE